MLLSYEDRNTNVVVPYKLWGNIAGIRSTDCIGTNGA